MSFYLETRVFRLAARWTREGCNEFRNGRAIPWETRAQAEAEMAVRKNGERDFDDPMWREAEYRLIPYRQLPDREHIDRVAALPDYAFCSKVRPYLDGFQVSVDTGDKHWVSDPDFGGGWGKTVELAMKSLADKVRADVRGDGKYAPHWDQYDIVYRLLKAWEERAIAGPARPTA